jgi:molecular chaperone IbpA
LAGYTKSDVKVEVADGVLSIEGSINKEAEDYIYRGISKRAFSKKLQLSEYVECNGAKFEDGMLKVDLEYNPPEDKRAKLIEVK